jgi:uncharacterized protein YigA (DUF484 family)
MNPQDIINHLQAHPEFFEQHPELFAALTLPTTHGGRAISLTERQMMTLREKNKVLELKIAELMRYGQENEAIAEKFQRWTRLLLLQRQARLIPETLTASLAEIFNVPHLALRVWATSPELAELSCTEAVPVELVRLTDQQRTPYCGPATETKSDAVALLKEANIQSIALIPLRRGATPESFGVLVLGSADPRRFHGGMATDFLAHIGETASAALTRLLN